MGRSLVSSKENFYICFMLTKCQVLCLLVLTSLTQCVGCGGEERIKVNGTVTLAGQPVPKAVVMFMSDAGGRPVVANTDEEGQYELTLMGSGDGAVAGSYRVTVVALEEEGELSARPPVDEKNAMLAEIRGKTREPRWRTPKRYASPGTSGLSFDVKANEENLANFSLVK